MVEGGGVYVCECDDVGLRWKIVEYIKCGNKERECGWPWLPFAIWYPRHRDTSVPCLRRSTSRVAYSPLSKNGCGVGADVQLKTLSVTSINLNKPDSLTFSLKPLRLVSTVARGPRQRMEVEGYT